MGAAAAQRRRRRRNKAEGRSHSINIALNGRNNLIEPKSPIYLAGWQSDLGIPDLVDLHVVGCVMGQSDALLGVVDLVTLLLQHVAIPHLNLVFALVKLRHALIDICYGVTLSLRIIIVPLMIVTLLLLLLIILFGAILL